MDRDALIDHPSYMITSRAFEALHSGWEAVSDALARAEAEVGSALEEFHRTGHEHRLHDALLRRTQAQADLRDLVHLLWTHPLTAEVFAPLTGHGPLDPS
jgi:hypothetical protein